MGTLAKPTACANPGLQTVESVVSGLFESLLGGGNASRDIRDTRDNRDNLVALWAERFNEVPPGQAFELTPDEIEAALKTVSPETQAQLKAAAKNISTLAAAFTQRLTEPLMLSPEAGLDAGLRVIPVERALCYAPGGRYPLPSTALMTVCTAKAAGVPEIYLTSPNMHPSIVAAGVIAGATRFFRLGGAHAIGAFAVGTARCPQVDIIAGPGNAYVTEAKKQARALNLCGIDMLAGPSEVAVLADETANPDWIALDLLAQAEHDPDARAFLLTTSQSLAEAVANSLKTQLSTLDLPDFVQQSLKNSALVILPTQEACLHALNQLAAEHVHLQVQNADAVLPKVLNAGTVFVGARATVPLGDYAAGPNHTLPTMGTARFSGALNPISFMRVQGVVRVSEAPGSAQNTLALTQNLAQLEGLTAHAAAAAQRCKA